MINREKSNQIPLSLLVFPEIPSKYSGQKLFDNTDEFGLKQNKKACRLSLKSAKEEEII